jgi:hypothetical protein
MSRPSDSYSADCPGANSLVPAGSATVGTPAVMLLNPPEVGRHSLKIPTLTADRDRSHLAPVWTQLAYHFHRRTAESIATLSLTVTHCLYRITSHLLSFGVVMAKQEPRGRHLEFGKSSMPTVTSSSSGIRPGTQTGHCRIRPACGSRSSAVVYLAVRRGLRIRLLSRYYPVSTDRDGEQCLGLQETRNPNVPWSVKGRRE